MRALFYWPQCGLNYREMKQNGQHRPVFWVTATPEEVREDLGVPDLDRPRTQ